MAIRMGNSCVNCENLTSGNICSVHDVKVKERYTCDSFDMKADLKNDRSCLSCARYEEPSCPNPEKAAADMLCSHWAPAEVNA